MRCVYSKNKSLSTHIRTQPQTPTKDFMIKRQSLIVSPITVTSKKSKSFINIKKQLKSESPSKNKKLMLTQQLNTKKQLRKQEQSTQNKLIKTPSIINLLYEDDQQLLNQKILNQVKYQQSTRHSIKSSWRKIATQQNINISTDQYKEYGHGITLTKRMKDILGQTKVQQQLYNSKRPLKIRVTIKRPF